ncbi:zinc ABC transporter substrate-binding protein [candidate division KSB1 bacterium]|nr:zinc ABC transporter substrate-binding protein [candidate division KSB1 bacterium]
MKRIILWVICMIISKLVYAQPQYITTIQPFKMIMIELIGETGTVDCILPPGASPHTYELRPSDVKKIANATALVMGGRHLDDWAYSLQVRNRIELMHYVPKELFLPVLQRADEHHSDSPHDHDHGDMDPHFWTDPLIVKRMIPGLLSRLIEIDPDHANVYTMNARRFENELDRLIDELLHLFELSGRKPVILSHPFFQYFLNRFKIDLIDVIEKVPGKDPTPRELSKMIRSAEKGQNSIILTHPQLPDRSARIIAESLNAELLELDPLGGRPHRTSYFELIEYNARLLSEAFKSE